MDAPNLTRAEFAALARRAGLALSEAETAELFGAWAHLEALIERLRAPLRPAAEPATIFLPDKP